MDVSRPVFVNSVNRWLSKPLYLREQSVEDGLTHRGWKARWQPCRHRFDHARCLSDELFNNRLKVLAHAVGFGHSVPVTALNVCHSVVRVPGAQGHGELYLLPLKHFWAIADGWPRRHDVVQGCQPVAALRLDENAEVLGMPIGSR